MDVHPGEAMSLSESEVGEWRALVTELVQRLDAAPLPLVMRYERAARELDCSVSKLRAMIRAGTIRTVVVHKRRMVPRSELERLTAMKLPKRMAQRAPAAKPNGATEAEAYRASLKKRR